VNEEVLAHWGLSRQEQTKDKKLLWFSYSSEVSDFAVYFFSSFTFPSVTI
jgi:hypothetical protein